MGIMVYSYSLLRVMQHLYHQPYFDTRILSGSESLHTSAGCRMQDDATTQASLNVLCTAPGRVHLILCQTRVHDLGLKVIPTKDTLGAKYKLSL